MKAKLSHVEIAMQKDVIAMKLEKALKHIKHIQKDIHEKEKRLNKLIE